VPARRILVLGGARSGKSLFAEEQARAWGGPVLYVATATIGDDREMAARIAHHRARRPADWRTLEEPRRVADAVTAALAEMAAARGPVTLAGTPIVVVEDITLLLSNLMTADIEAAEELTRAEIGALLTLEAHVILVSNEVGMGLVPTSVVGRHFRDALGRVNQFAAAVCGEVHFIVAGLSLRLK
jgi:adenosylcobinamide kinase/adenosylcobinamide-phosphate guanylyltransferase